MRADDVLAVALELGFDLAGLAPLAPPPAAERFERWLAAGHQAGMAWLEANRARIVDPRGLVPGARTLLVVGLAHGRAAVELPDGARIARYAAGRDYHGFMLKRLRRLRRVLQERGLVRPSRIVVDAGPLLERSHAAVAGLGFESKAANLLDPRHGPWFFLGELVLEEELQTAPSPPAGSCGTCTACLDACPTAAIRAPGVVDANLCLSYHTIENRGAVPHELRRALDGWAFGCDVCSEVCPWGRDAPDRSGVLGTHRALRAPGLAAWLEAPAEGFAERFVGSPLRRAGRDGIARNAALVLGNRAAGAGERGRDALAAAAEADRAPLVREAAVWGLVRGYGADAAARASAERALAREPDAGARAAMRRTLEHEG